MRSRHFPSPPARRCGTGTGAAWAQILTRDGFDITRHPVSLLALGEFGWIQVANFVGTGLLFLAGAAGLRRAMVGRRGRTWGPVLVGVFAVALVWAGAFAADPADGFPVGAPAVTEPTRHGIAHNVAPAAGVLALIVACIVFARRFATQRRRGWMAYSIVSGAAMLVPDLFLGRDGFTAVLAVATAVGWCWVSAVAIHHLTVLRRIAGSAP